MLPKPQNGSNQAIRLSWNDEKICQVLHLRRRRRLHPPNDDFHDPRGLFPGNRHLDHLHGLLNYGLLLSDDFDIQRWPGPWNASYVLDHK